MKKEMTLVDEIYYLYARYTPQEIAEAIAEYRREVELNKQVEEIDTKIMELKTRRKKLKPDDAIPN